VTHNNTDTNITETHQFLFMNRRGRDSMVVGFTTTFTISAYISTNVVNSNPAQVRCTRYNIMFPPPIKLTVTT